MVARRNPLAHRTGLGEVEHRIDPVVGVRRIGPGVVAVQTGQVEVQVVVDTVLGAVVGRIGLEVARHTVLEVVAVHTDPEVAVVDIAQVRHNPVAGEELHTGPEVDRRTDLAAAHHIDLAVVADHNLVEAGSLRTVGSALVAVVDSLAVEVVDTVDVDRSLVAAGLGPDTAADNRLVGCSCRTCSAVI